MHGSSACDGGSEATGQLLSGRGVSYRLVKLAWHYPEYVSDFVRRHPLCRESPYAVAAAELHADAFAWADFYCRNLRALGVEAHELVSNADWLQAAWAREHGCRERGDALVLEQLRTLRPDVLFVQNIFRFGAAFIQAARQRVPTLRLVLGWCSAPYTARDEVTFRACDAMLGCTPGFVADFLAGGHRGYLLNHAFETTLLDTLPPPVAAADVVFAGTVVKGQGWHNLRARLLEQIVLDGFELRVFGRLVEESPGRTRLKQAAWAAGRVLDSLGLRGVTDRLPGVRKMRTLPEAPRIARFPGTLRKAVRPPVYGLAMYGGLRSARVALNVHVDATPRFAGNMRLFETTGVGTCLLTDWKENLSDLFDLNSEVVAFRSVQECSEKLRWLLADESARQAIAVGGQRRTLRDHTFAVRAAKLDDVVRHLLAAT